MIPLKYNVRNLRARWVTTVLTVLGVGMVVWSSCLLFGLVDGLRHSLNVSGEPLDLIALRKGSTTEINSAFGDDTARELANLDGLARDEQGKPLCSAEIVNIPIAERVDGSRANLIVRGVDPAGPKLRSSFRIVSGRMFEPGRGEAIVSATLTRRFRGAGLGEELKVGERESYRVVGLFTAGGGAAESEVWVDRRDLARNTGREGFVSCAQLRADSSADLDRLRNAIANDARFKLDAPREIDFYEAQSRTALFLKAVGVLIAVFLTVGAMFASANTMYSAVGARTREIGTMRALGFPKSDILLSFLGESVLICALGGLLGLIATFPLRALTFETNNLDTFASLTLQFRFGAWVLAAGATMTAAMGILGGFFPALRAVRLDVVRALREV